MCTVTFFPIDDSILITSNRDEYFKRGQTLNPQQYIHNNILLTYPLDTKSGGTWIAFTEKKTAAVLLNGAFKNHSRKENYRHSRGLIIPQIIAHENPVEAFEKFDCRGIEPFTLVLYANDHLIEYKWDELKLCKEKLPITEPHFWCSVTLYEAKNFDENFADFKLLGKNTVSRKSLIEFHQSKKYENQLADKSAVNNIKTVSITQMVIEKNKAEMHYYNLTN